ncbi:MAG TPA: sigma-70 family RNA polymerase sigma factor [Pseudonocardiaceae bacterium]|jgi:RNA polymerase sigma factor (sigma-70 family)|nr:sigma-70 family RNA polymerase sigma factor [Pseudonocardiaceae bacterium]
MSRISTSELARAAGAGDQAAWRELVRRYNGLVWTVAREHGLPAADAADVTQATWLALAQRLPRLRDPDRLAAWLATTARRQSLRVLAIRRRETPLDWADVHTVLDGIHVDGGYDAGPDGAVLAADADGALWRAFGTLPDRCRQLLRLLAHAPELSYAQAGRALGIGLGSVGPTRSRCLAALRRRLESAGVHP